MAHLENTSKLTFHHYIRKVMVVKNTYNFLTRIAKNFELSNSTFKSFLGTMELLVGMLFWIKLAKSANSVDFTMTVTLIRICNNYITTKKQFEPTLRCLLN